MDNVHLTPDGDVFVRTGNGEYAATRADFLADLDAAGIALSAPFPEAPFQYAPGYGWEDIDDTGCHTMPDGRDWTDGDALIAAVDDLIQARTVRETPPPPPEPTYEEVQADAIQQIDATAERTRHRYITPGSGQALEYEQAFREAVDFQAAGYPEADLADYPMLQAEAQATGRTGTVVCDEVLTLHAQWVAVGAAIRRERRAGKEAVRAAATVAEVETTRDNAIAALEAL